jgi:hypothetical protein
VTLAPVRRSRRARRRRGPLLLALAGAAAAFAVGVALGEALGDDPEPGRTQTLVRTLHPLPLAPAARETVTVTVSNP